MKVEKYDFGKRHTKEELKGFADMILELQDQIGFKISARGWCYQLEQAGHITKAEFSKVENLINKCRKEGIIPIDFVAEEEGRQFSQIHNPDTMDYGSHIRRYVSGGLSCENYYTPDWWEGEDYYIQMIVEKIDLKTLFEPVCADYHIPIATSKGWSSITQRAAYARRYKEAEDRGLKCVLLYCGDYDPDGLRISDFLRSNLEDVRDVYWEDGEDGYDPADLIIERFGLRLEFINENKLSWIDNLITGSGSEIAKKLPSGQIVAGKTASGRPHKNFNLPYVQKYLKKVGVRKCEANSLVPYPQKARDYVRTVIEEYLGSDALARFAERKRKVVNEIKEYRDTLGITDLIKEVLDRIDNPEDYRE